MLALSAAAVGKERSKKDHKKLVWVDIGGGTGELILKCTIRTLKQLSLGWNIEQMARYMDIHDFEVIYVVDYCE